MAWKMGARVLNGRGPYRIHRCGPEGDLLSDREGLRRHPKPDSADAERMGACDPRVSNSIPRRPADRDEHLDVARREDTHARHGDMPVEQCLGGPCADARAR
jgi:hypothetical protein